MFVKRYGKGNRIFFGIHGWSGDHSTFDPLIRYLPEDVSLYSLDLPGFGHSPRPDEWSLDCIAAEIAAAVTSIGKPEGVTLIGNCSGAIFGLVAMPLIGHMINRLILIDPFAYTPWYFKIFVSTPVGKYAYYSAFANPIGRMIANLSLKDHRTEETDLTGSFKDVDHEVAYRYLKLMTDIDGISGFSGIRHPIDIVYGEKTFHAIRRSVEMWKGIWPQATSHELIGAGHLPIEESTEALSRFVFRDSTTQAKTSY